MLSCCSPRWKSTPGEAAGSRPLGPRALDAQGMGMLISDPPGNLLKLYVSGCSFIYNT